MTHSLFPAQPERWLETLVREDVTRLDASLDPRIAYAQVLANAAGEHGILDVLTVTRSGRLAILQLKASESLSLTIQAADCLLRIKRHRNQGDIARYGYFPGIELQSAPHFAFHPATDTLLCALSP